MLLGRRMPCHVFWRPARPGTIYSERIWGMNKSMYIGEDMENVSLVNVILGRGLDASTVPGAETVIVISLMKWISRCLCSYEVHRPHGRVLDGRFARGRC